MPNPLTISIGRAVQAVAALRGGGSALPGLIVEKLEPGFAAAVLGKLPLGVVLISGTNGKTTTVKIVSELLQAAGLKVFTNSTGSNFMRGVVSSLLRKVRLSGRLDADIAVLELDEAHAVTFVEAIKPCFALLLNVMADQTDRFGEIDYTTKLLTAVAESATNTVVLNREDARLAAIPKQHALAAAVHWFGLAEGVRETFFGEKNTGNQEGALVSRCARDTTETPPLTPPPLPAPPLPHATLLSAFAGTAATFEIKGTAYKTSLALKGVHNAFNAAAALALVHAVLPATPPAELIAALASVQPAFGRGESILVGEQPLELVLVKNPGGFSLALRGYDPAEAATMIIVNDHYGDGRDVSWFYDMSFASLRESGVAMVGGTRAWDMALRLEYDEVAVQAVEPELSTALDRFLTESRDGPRLIYCCYTGMLALRKLLATKAEVEQIR